MTWMAVVRVVCGVLAGIAVALTLLIAVELYSSVVHPMPEDFDHSMEQMCQHVANYPNWVLATVVPMWGLIAYLCTWVAGRIGRRACALLIGVMFNAAVFWNVAMLPYPMWFKIVMPIVAVIAARYAVVMSSRPRAVPVPQELSAE